MPFMQSFASTWLNGHAAIPGPSLIYIHWDSEGAQENNEILSIQRAASISEGAVAPRQFGETHHQSVEPVETLVSLMEAGLLKCNKPLFHF